MIVVWGHGLRIDLLGVVADRCPLCRRIAKGALEKVAIADHLFFVALDPGRDLETRFRCHSCGGTTRVDPRAYESPLTARASKPMAVDEVLRRTNARLLDEIERLADAELAVRRWCDGGQTGDDPRVELIRLKLEDADDEVEAGRLGALLERWREFDEAIRQRALDDAARLGRRVEYNRAVAAHAHWAAQRFLPTYHIGWFFSFACVLIIVGLLVVPHRGPDDASVWVVVIGSFLASAVLYVPIHRFLHRRFFRTVFLPEAARRQINPEHSLAWLRWYKSQKPEANNSSHLQALRGLADASDRLSEVLQERALLGPRVEENAY